MRNGKRETLSIRHHVSRFSYPVSRITDASSARGLFVPQRYDRIQCRRPPRRPDAEEQAHQRAEDEGDEDCEHVYRGVPMRELGEADRPERAEENPDDPPGEA